MIARIVEVTQGPKGMNYGKFLLARLDIAERNRPTAMPEDEHHTPWWRYGGLRKMNPWTTLVLDCQTGEGACFSLEGSEHNATWDLEEHKVWVCPMYEPFLRWLYAQQRWAGGRGDLADLPEYLELPDAPGAFSGYRREGPRADTG